jgi:hypothetical protein
VARFIAHGFGNHSPEPGKCREARTIRLKAGAFVCDDTLPGAQRQAKSSSQEFPKRAHFVRVEPRELDSSIQHRPAWNGRDAVKCLAFQRVRVL